MFANSNWHILAQLHIFPDNIPQSKNKLGLEQMVTDVKRKRRSGEGEKGRKSVK